MKALSDPLFNILANEKISDALIGQIYRLVFGFNFGNADEYAEMFASALKEENDEINRRIAENKAQKDIVNRMKCRRRYLKVSRPDLTKEQIDDIVAEEAKKGKFNEKDSHLFTPFHTDSHLPHTDSHQFTRFHPTPIPSHPIPSLPIPSHPKPAPTGHTGHKVPDRDLNDAVSAPLWDNFISYCLSQMVVGDDEGLFRQSMEELFNRLNENGWKTKDKKPIADWHKFVNKCIKADRDEDKFSQEPSVEVEETHTEMDDESVGDSSDVSNFV